MTTRICVLRILITLLISGCSVADVCADSNDLPGQAVVQLDRHSSAARVFRGAGVTVLDSVPGLGLYLVSFPADIPIERKRAALARRPGILRTHPNRSLKLVRPFQVEVGWPDDDAPVFVSGEQPASYYGQPSVLSIGLDSAHTLSQGDGVTIAIIDNGVDRTHPLLDSLSAPLLNDLVDSDDDPSEVPGALYGHGTFTAGLIRLAAPAADLMVIRAFDSSGVSTIFTISQAISWAVDNGADVINMSFGTSVSNGLLELACSRAIQAGVVLVAAVGNAGTTQPVYPAAYNGVIGVGAIDTLDFIAPFSNGNSADVCAPGISLYSALPNPWLWGTWSGTSFSAALVSATAGLVLALSPEMAPLDVESHLRSTADTNLAWGAVIPPDLYYGYGRINAWTAVLAFQPMPAAKSGVFTVSDVRLIAEACATGYVRGNSSAWRLDLNHDGVINRADLELAVRLLFGPPDDPDPFRSRPQR